jgi:hypothetical protein
MLMAVAMNNTSQSERFRYPYEEFGDHIKAMKTVREWEHTVRFGDLGSDQTTRSNSARVIEYFSDCYDDGREALYKAGTFLSIYDYIGRHEEAFAKKNLLEKVEERQYAVEPALLRAVHYVFTTVSEPAGVEPKQVMALARIYRQLVPAE